MIQNTAGCWIFSIFLGSLTEGDQVIELKKHYSITHAMYMAILQPLGELKGIMRFKAWFAAQHKRKIAA